MDQRTGQDQFSSLPVLAAGGWRQESHLCVSGERGVNDPGQELAVDGRCRDDLSGGHGRDAVQRLVLGILVLHGGMGKHACRSRSRRTRTNSSEENVPPSHSSNRLLQKHPEFRVRTTVL